MTIIKQNKDVVVGTNYHIVTKKALTAQAIEELYHEAQRYQYYKMLQGNMIPRIYQAIKDEITMEYCPGTHTAQDKQVLDLRKQIVSVQTPKGTIDRNNWQRLIKEELIQQIHAIPLGPEESAILTDLINSVSDTLSKKPIIQSSYCHGDLQKHNIIQEQDKESIKIIDPKPVRMHHTYDLMYYAVCENIDLELITAYCADYPHAIVMLDCMVLRKLHVYCHAGEYAKIGPLLQTYMRIKNNMI